MAYYFVHLLLSLVYKKGLLRMYTNKTILLTKEICQVIGIRDTIKKLGFQPISVENDGTDIIQKATLLRPCGIITQFLLTDRSAVKIIQRLKKDQAPILYFIVGDGKVPSVIEQIIRSGNTYYLCIPAEMNEKRRAERINQFIRDELDSFAPEYRANALLLQLGIMPRRIGYSYIKDSVMLLLKQCESYSCGPEHSTPILLDPSTAAHAVAAYGNYKKILH